MAGLKPFFLTGANAKIIVNGVAIAFATNISYSVAVNHNSPRVLGRYEVEEHSPLSYDVMGGFSIIRYAKDLRDTYAGAATHNNNLAERVANSGIFGDFTVKKSQNLGTVPEGVNNKGNGIGAWQKGSGNTLGSLLSLPFTEGAGNGHANENLVPERLYQSQMFDIEIRQQVDGTECTIALLRNCRITGANFNLANKRSVATQAFTFKAQAVDEDTFVAMKSGVGQELV